MEVFRLHGRLPASSIGADGNRLARYLGLEVASPRAFAFIMALRSSNSIALRLRIAEEASREIVDSPLSSAVDRASVNAAISDVERQAAREKLGGAGSGDRAADVERQAAREKGIRGIFARLRPLL